MKTTTSVEWQRLAAAVRGAARFVCAPFGAADVVARLDLDDALPTLGEGNASAST